MKVLCGFKCYFLESRGLVEVLKKYFLYNVLVGEVVMVDFAVLERFFFGLKFIRE